MKKFLAVIITATLAMLGVISIQSVAEAHVGDITAVGTCVDADTMTVTYTVGWSNGTATGKLYQQAGLHGQTGNAGNSTSGWTYVKDVAGASGTATFVISYEKSAFGGTTNGPWHSSKVIFSDGYGVAADTRIEGWDWSKCAAKDASFTKSISTPTCQTGAVLTYSGSNVTFSQASPISGPKTAAQATVTATPTAGHQWSTAPNDSAARSVSNVALAGPISSDDNSCAVKDAAAVVTTTPPSCQSASVASVLSVSHATLNGTLSQTVGNHVATFTADAGHRFPDGSKTADRPYTISAQTTGDDCASILIPVSPTVTQDSCTGPGTSGGFLIALATTPSGVSYTLSGLVVTATADSAHKFDTVPAGWVKVDNHHATFTVTKTSAGDCLVTIEPKTPTYSDDCGPNNVKWNAFPSVDHATWTTAENGDAVLTADQGYTFGNAKHVFSLPSDKGDKCTVPVPGTPDQTDPCGPNNATWNVPANTEHVKWSIIDGHLWAHIPVIQQDTWSFDDGTVSHDYGAPTDSGDYCTLTVGHSAGATGAGCVINEGGGSEEGLGAILVGDEAHVTYHLGTATGPVLTGSTPEAPGEYVIVAVPDDGYTFGEAGSAGGPVEQTVTVNSTDQPCVTLVSPVAPTVTQDTCVNGQASGFSITLATEPTGVTYTLDGLTVTASTSEGFGFSMPLPAGWSTQENGTATYTVVRTSPGDCYIPPPPSCENTPSLCPPPPTCANTPSLCPPPPTCANTPSLCPTPVVFAAPAAAPPTCDTAGSFTLPDRSGLIEWSISPAYNGPGTYTVTATLVGNTVWSDGVTTRSRSVQITVDGALGFQSSDPTAPCYHAPPPPHVKKAWFRTVSYCNTVHVEGRKNIASIEKSHVGNRYVFIGHAKPGALFSNGKDHIKKVRHLKTGGGCNSGSSRVIA